MTTNRKPPEDEDIVYLDDEGGDEVARALAEAEKAVSAVEERHRKQSGEHKAPAPIPATEVEMAAASLEALPEAAPKAPSPAAERVAELERLLAEERERAVRAEEEAGRLREALLRKAADVENIKRRSEREKTDFFKFALAETFRDLLGILDNLQRALAHGPEATNGEDFRVGIEMTARQFTDTLRKYGLSEIPAQGLPFDPTVHEAVMRQETDSASPGTVLEVFQRGYILNDRLLRPALVKVAGAPARPQGDD